MEYTIEKSKLRRSLNIHTNFVIDKSLIIALNATSGVEEAIGYKYHILVDTGKLFKTEAVIKNIKSTLDNYIYAFKREDSKDDLLRYLLELAVEREEYEKAILLRDQLKDYLAQAGLP